MKRLSVPVLVTTLWIASGATASGEVDLQLTPVGTYHSTIYDEGGAEIVAHDPIRQRLFVVNANDTAIDVIDIRDVTNPTKVAVLDASSLGGGANSVAVAPYPRLVAVAIEADVKQDPGLVAFYDADSLELIHTVQVGALPDMLTFTPGGLFLLVANEGEPDDDYLVDPPGSISIINLFFGTRHAWVRTADFERWDGREDELRAKGVRIYGPGASASQDLEPEYIAVSSDGRKAWVSLQENNAMAIVDVWRARVRRIVPLGTKDHALPENMFDASNEDGAIAIAPWPTQGLFQPDGIASYRRGGRTWIVSANEGDSRDYDGFSEEERVEDVTLDPAAFPDASLQDEEKLGRLNITTTLGQTPAGDYAELFSYGARSISIWNSRGRLVWDSGKQLEEITATVDPANFNATNDDNDSFDNRSDDKGPEPENVTVGRIRGRDIAFAVLERVGGIVAYDVTNPQAPRFLTYTNNRNFDADVCLVRDPLDDDECFTGAGNANPEAGDLGPEGIVFVPARKSPNGKPLVITGNEVSGTTTIFEVTVD